MASSHKLKNFDVFLSFQGKDTRVFVGFLYEALDQRGIQTFIDYNLHRGENMSEELFKTIENSSASIIVFSKNYASSSLCLDELAKIMECSKKVLPVFYQVDPFEVRKQTGNYGKELTMHEEKIKDKTKVQRWREALSKAANISGFDCKNSHTEFEVVQKIVEEILNSEFIQMPSNVATMELVGINSHIEALTKLLDIESADVRMVGITGLGGVGKTTIAKAIYNRFSNCFKAKSFLENVREWSKTDQGIIHLQKTLLKGISKDENLRVNTIYEGTTMINKILRLKKVLIILDDVDNIDQIETFLGQCECFAFGSRIILTTRYKSLLINRNDFLTYDYEVEDIELFRKHAFPSNEVPEDDLELKKQAISYAKGLPLALKVMGRDLPNTWSNQDGVQDLSFESIEVSEISELMDLPTRVHSLRIEGCDDLEFIPKGVMSSELSLQDLYIINCCSLKSFPKDHLPAALKILYIRDCKKLNFPLTTEKKTHQDALLEYLCIGSSCDSLKSISLDLFPNLKSLSIWDCANLELLSMPVQKNLTSLEALEIRDCPNLVSFLGEGLRTMNLTSVWLSNCKKLEKLPELHTLDSLQSMFINNCPELVSLSEKGLPSRLSLLSITFCNKLKLKDEWGLDGLDYLRRLEIEGGCVDVGSFPEKFLPSNLSSLRISGLLNLKNLDNKGFQQLTALQRLEISCCPNLQSFPEDGFPSSLSFLCIKECPLLTSKFRNKKGKDWSKIDHISCIEIDEEVIS